MKYILLAAMSGMMAGSYITVQYARTIYKNEIVKKVSECYATGNDRICNSVGVDWMRNRRNPDLPKGSTISVSK